MTNLHPTKLVYVAGPYSAPTVHERIIHIHKAWEVGAKLGALGVMPIVPHKNTELYDDVQPGTFWLEGTLELMRRCDAVMLVDGWEWSRGTCGEIREARARGLPIFVLLAQVRRWLTKGETPGPEYYKGMLQECRF